MTMMTILVIVVVGVAMAMMTSGMSVLARAAVATMMTIVMTIGIVAAPVVAAPSGTRTTRMIEEAGRGRARGTRMMTMTGIEDGLAVRATTVTTMTRIVIEGAIEGLVVTEVVVRTTKMTVIVHPDDGLPGLPVETTVMKIVLVGAGEGTTEPPV